MTHEEERRFIRLWQQGVTTAAIAQQLDIPRGTVASRAYTLVRQGKIQARPKGGAFPHQQARTRPTLALSDTTQTAPVQTPVPHPAPPGAVHNTVHTPLDSAPTSPDLSGVLTALVERLSAIEDTLKQGGVQRYTPVQDYAPVQHYAPVQDAALPGIEPPRLSAQDRKSERWNIYMPRWIRQRIERAAAVEGMSPSQFLQRLCGPWAATWQDPSEGEP
jgi:hypothetical protein